MWGKGEAAIALRIQVQRTEFDQQSRATTWHADVQRDFGGNYIDRTWEFRKADGGEPRRRFRRDPVGTAQKAPRCSVCSCPDGTTCFVQTSATTYGRARAGSPLEAQFFNKIGERTGRQLSKQKKTAGIILRSFYLLIPALRRLPPVHTALSRAGDRRGFRCQALF